MREKEAADYAKTHAEYEESRDLSFGSTGTGGARTDIPAYRERCTGTNGVLVFRVPVRKIQI